MKIPSVYRSIFSSTIKVEHAGLEFKESYSTFLCFYENNICAVYMSNADNVKPFFNKRNHQYKGEYKEKQNGLLMNLFEHDELKYKIELFFNSDNSIATIKYSDYPLDGKIFHKIDLNKFFNGELHGEIIANIEIMPVDSKHVQIKLFKGEECVVIQEIDNKIRVKILREKPFNCWLPKDAVRMWKL